MKQLRFRGARRGKPGIGEHPTEKEGQGEAISIGRARSGKTFQLVRAHIDAERRKEIADDSGDMGVPRAANVWFGEKLLRSVRDAMQQRG